LRSSGKRLKKRVCARQNKSEPTLPTHAGAGFGSNAGLIRPGWCLSTKLSGSRPARRATARPWAARTLGDDHGRGRSTLQRNESRSWWSGAMNKQAFMAYLEYCLAPTLRRNDIVIMTTSLPTEPLASDKRSKLPARPFVTGLNARRTSTRSRFPSANSRHSCASLLSGPFPGLFSAWSPSSKS